MNVVVVFPENRTLCVENNIHGHPQQIRYKIFDKIYLNNMRAKKKEIN